MKTEMYRQCSLKRGNERMTSWIPIQFAEIGKVIKLRNEFTMGCLWSCSDWSDGWVVDEKFNPVIDPGRLSCMASQHLHTRSVSDV